MKIFVEFPILIFSKFVYFFLINSRAHCSVKRLCFSFFFFFQKTNIQELEEEIRTKNSTSVKSKCNSTPSHGNSHPSSVATHHSNAGPPEAGTLRHRKKSRPAPPPPPSTHDLEIRNPSELLVGVPSTLKAQWRHKPSVLVTGTVDYTASVSVANSLDICLAWVITLNFLKCFSIWDRLSSRNYAEPSRRRNQSKS